VGETLLELAGVGASPDVDARSFAGVLAEPARAHRPDQVCLEQTYSALRTETHKLIATHSQREELYDLREDPWETRNVAADQPDLAHELRTQLRARLQEGAWSR
jgi:iduronate 2-sulfatase